MFRAAYEIAREYTRPVLLSRKTISGKCSCSIGSLVVVNREGWFVTANHIFAQLDALVRGEKLAKDLEQRRADLEANPSLDFKEKKRQLRKLQRLSADDTERASVWWSFDGARLADAGGLDGVDIAVGRLEPFDASSIKTYPVFKDPTSGFQPGVSLCKLGFPFHSVVPTWDPAKNGFVLPPGALPLPLFPMEGMFTREVELTPPAGSTLPYPFRLIETSTPGLKGQSGGPIFDVHGIVWGIQVQTWHLPLGFNPQVPGGRPGEKEHQFLNVGMGAHPATIFELFKEKGVKFEISAR